MKPFQFIFICSNYPNNTATTQCVSRLINAIHKYIEVNSYNDDIKVVSANSIFDVKNSSYYRDCEVIHMFRNKSVERLVKIIPVFSYYIYYPIWHFIQLAKILFKTIIDKFKPVIIIISDKEFSMIKRTQFLTHIFKGLCLIYRTEKPDILCRSHHKIGQTENNYRKLWINKYYNAYVKFDALILETPRLVRYYSVLLKNKLSSIIIPTFPDISEIPITDSNNDNTKTVITYAGGLHPLKKDGITYLIRAANILNNSRIELQIVGNICDNNFYNLLVDLVDKNSKTKINFFTNLSRDEYMKKLAKTNIFVLYKEKDNYSNAGISSKLMEYLRFGKPVVITKYVNYFPLNLENDKNIYIIEEENESCLASKLLFIINSMNSSNVGIAGRDELYKSINPLQYVDSLYVFLHRMLKDDCCKSKEIN